MRSVLTPRGSRIVDARDLGDAAVRCMLAPEPALGELLARAPTGLVEFLARSVAPHRARS